MGHYAVLYGKLGAIKGDFFSPADISRLEEMGDYGQAINYLVNRGLLRRAEQSGVSSRQVERQLRERFLSKVNSFRFYLPGLERSFFEFLLYKYDIYNLKILLALHFSHHDREVAEFVYRNTPLFRRYAFLMDKESFLDKDLLLAFKGTAIFPFLMHAYRNYKQKGDLFFLDTVLEDEYYQHMLKILSSMRDNKLTRVLSRVLLVHNIIWGMRMHFIYSMSKEEIFYYLVLPVPGVSSSDMLGLFSVKQVTEFRDKLKSFLHDKIRIFEEVEFPSELVGIKKALWDGLMKELWNVSLSLDVLSLSGVLSWILCQEMMLDKVSFILYSFFMNEIKEGNYAQVVSP